MSSKPPKPGFPNSQFEPSAMYPLYMSPHYDLHAPSPAALPDHFLTSRTKASDVQSGVPEGGGTGLSFAERFKRWSFEPERGISASDLHSYSASPLLSANSDHQLLCSSAAAGHGEDIAGAVKEAHARASLVDSSIGGGLNVAFLPLSSSSTPFPEGTYRTSTNKPQYCTAQADMEILRANEGHNVVSESVHLFQDIPSSLTHQSADLSSASDYHLPYSNPTQRLHPFVSNLTTLHRSNNHESQLFSDHHQPWGPALRVSSAATNPHAELLLLPGISESVEEASNASGIPEAALSAGSTHDLLHVSSLHDKQGSAMALPLGVIGGTGRPPPHIDQFWNADKLDMTVGLGIHENPARRFIPQLPLTDADHHASMRCAVQSGLSLLLQPPLQRGHSAVLAFDPARYNARSASGSLGVLRNSKYLKAAQQLLNECCNVYRDGNGRTRRSSDASKGSCLSISYNNMRWSGGVGGDGCAAEGDVDDDDEKPGRSLFASGRSHYHNLQHRNDQNKEQQEKTSTGADHQPAAKQMPAEERCNLQMRKTRLIAMVEELDRRYQQYRDQMQLIVTSYESAAGMGGAAAYTTLARKAMSRQFRGLRDAIGEHIRAVCRTLGEEVSSVPILSRGETPRLRLVDQQLRHQRSLQQIGMLPQQQAWRPQRGLPERSVSVLRAWLFEHFLHPYPKDSEKAMLARLTGLSRNQVSNWFINARVRLWKPMIEEMYIEEGKALQEEGAEGIINAGMDEIEQVGEQDGPNGSFTHGVEIVVSNNMSSMHWITTPAAEKQPESLMQNHFIPLRGQGLDPQVHLLLSGLHPTHHSALGGSAAHNELQSFIQFHSSARNAAMTGDAPSPVLPSADCHSHPFSWMKLPPAAPAGTAHLGDYGNILTTGSTQLYDHSPHHQLSSDSQASALIQQQHRQGPQLSSSASNLYKNGVSLTLGLQQPPLHSAFNPNPSSASNPYHGRPSEALLF